MIIAAQMPASRVCRRAPRPYTQATDSAPVNRDSVRAENSDHPATCPQAESSAKYSGACPDSRAMIRLATSMGVDAPSTVAPA